MSKKQTKIRTKLLAAVLTSSLCLHLSIRPGSAEDKSSSKTLKTVQSLQPGMRAASEAYQDLIGLLYDAQSFSDPKNTQRIKGNLARLQNNFHSSDKKFSVLEEDPTASANLAALSEAIKDSAKRFDEGNFDYARWRLKTINLNCITCHASNQSQIYSRQAEAPQNAPKHEQADFYLASRRFDRAKELFAEIVVGKGVTAEASRDMIERLRALRGWLWVTVRHEVLLATTPDDKATRAKSAAQTLINLVSKVNFSDETSKVIERWGKDLETLESDISMDNWVKTSLTANDEFVTFASEPTHFVKVLYLMQILTERLGSLSLGEKAQGTALLQKSGNDKKTGGVTATDLNTERAQIMLKLGLLTSQSYDLTWDNLPDAYLKSCIKQVPKSPLARLCFEALKDFMEREFMGPGGTQLPSDVKLSLDEAQKLVN